MQRHGYGNSLNHWKSHWNEILSVKDYHSIAWISPEFASLATFVTAAMLCINIYLLLPLVMIIVLIKNRETIYRLYNLKK